MKLHAAIDDYQADIRITDEGGRVFAEVDGRHYELDVHRSGAGGYLLVSNSEVFDCRVEGQPESGKPVDVIVGTGNYLVTLTDPKRLSTATSVSTHGDDTARIVAPMPGKVVRVLVEVGSPIVAGEGILVVEAMKMQNEMKSPKTGTLITLNVQAGATVNGGDVLAIIE